MVWLGAAAGGCGIKSAMRPPSLLKMPKLPSTEATEGSSGQAVDEQLPDHEQRVDDQRMNDEQRAHKNASVPQETEQGEEERKNPDKQKRK